MRLSDATTAAVEKVCARTMSCTVLVVSGRPMVIPPDPLYPYRFGLRAR